MAVIETVFALCMFVNSSLDGHMLTEGMSDCLRLKREAERNLSDNRENVIQYRCGQVVAELEPDSEGNMKIKKIIEGKY
jgi:hypothetical protein|tara:strand:+ start:592 stop:828 length:237 start_codon:yes stop_codon:yes gene_type:complete